MTAPYLEIQQSGEMRRLPIGGDAVTIGRHADNRLVIADPRASRFHAVVEKKGHEWTLRDLKSSNGTMLNGQPVTESSILPGDVITIGKVRIVLLDPTSDGPPLTSDVLEALSEEDLVLEEPAAPVNAYRPSEDVNADPEIVLRSLAESMLDKTFTEDRIALYNARGTVAYAAGDVRRRGAGPDMVSILRLVLLLGVRSHASDIHLEPKENYWQLRMRVDGTMVDVVRLQSEWGGRFGALVKVLCDLDMAQRNVVQEGRFSARAPGNQAVTERRIDYRCSFAPSVSGQKLVIRILDAVGAPLKIDDLNLPREMSDRLGITIEQDSGMVLVCGPTGSGKTTTLYALLRTCDVRQRNFITIEDPVEIALEGVTQMGVDESQGKTFSALLRSVLRQDPDGILVGEVRDPETAKIAMQAAVTGHLVFSTVHTKDTLGTIYRLMDFGVEPFLVAQALHNVLAQRLVRQLCPFCKQVTEPTADQLKRLQAAGIDARRIYEPRGCQRCMGTGHVGRRGVYELLTVDDALRSAIMRNAPLDQIRDAALASGNFKSLMQSGYQLVADGFVAMGEVERVIGR